MMNLRDLVFFGIQTDADANPMKAVQKPLPKTRDSSDRLSVENLMMNADSHEDVSDQFLRKDGPSKVELDQDFLYQSNVPCVVDQEIFAQTEQEMGLPPLPEDLDVPEVQNDVSFEMHQDE